MPKANRQQQAAYDMTVLQALRSLMKPDAMGPLKQMAAKGDPAESIASAAAMALKTVMLSAKEAGHDLGMEYITKAGQEVILNIASVLVRFGTIDPKQQSAVMQQAIDIFKSIIGGQQAPQQPQQPAGLLAQGA